MRQKGSTFTNSPQYRNGVINFNPPPSRVLAVSNCKCQDSLGQYNEQTSLCCTEQSVKFLHLIHYPGHNHQVRPPNLTWGYFPFHSRKIQKLRCVATSATVLWAKFLRVTSILVVKVSGWRELSARALIRLAGLSVGRHNEFTSKRGGNPAHVNKLPTITRGWPLRRGECVRN